MGDRYIRMMIGALVALSIPPAAANAGALPEAISAASPQISSEREPVTDEVVVTGRRERSPLDSVIAERKFDRGELEAFGASSLSALLENLSPQMRSGGGNDPIILLNGRRISGFSEISSLPPEAIKSIDVLPESVALSYGYGASARVLNVVLVDRFRATIGEAQAAVPTEGGRASTRLALNILRIRQTTRWNLDATYRRETRLLESERGLDPLGSGRFRTLLPASETLTLNGSVSGFVLGGVSGTLNVRGELASIESRLGLAGYDPLFPPSSLFRPGTIDRVEDRRTGHVGTILNGRLSSWQWSLTTNFDHSNSVSRTEEDGGSALLQAASRSVDPAFHSLGGLAPSATPAAISTSRWRNSSAGTEGVLYGRLLSLPSGPLSVSFNAAAHRAVSSSFSSAMPPREQRSYLERDRLSFQMAADLPITAAAAGTGGGVGAVSLNGSVAVSELSDFGRIRRFGYGLDWRLRRWVTLTASATDEDRAPTMQQLGQAEVQTPGARTLDLLRGQSAFFTRIEGANPLLRKSNALTWKLGLLLAPVARSDLRIRADYTHVRERNPILDLLTDTTELETSYPDRFLRDSTGLLLAIDTRPVNFFRAHQETIRWGLSDSTVLRDKRAAGSEGSSGRVDIALFHTWTLRNDILLAQGGQRIDFLQGSASSRLGGFPRHQIELQSGFYKNGLGLRLSGYYRSRTFLGRLGQANSRLADFGALGTLNLTGFVDLGERQLTHRWPWTRNLRVSVSGTNLFNSRIDVRDDSGATPETFRPAYLDPLGRSVSVSLRKLF